MQGSREVIASTIFVPNGANPIAPANAYMRNCNGGGVLKAPLTVALGHWQIFIPQDVSELETSVTARSQLASGAAIRQCSAVISRNTPTPDVTRVDIWVRDIANAPQGDSSSIEVTLARLPL